MIALISTHDANLKQGIVLRQTEPALMPNTLAG